MGKIRKKVKTPSSQVKIVVKRKKPGKAICASCGKPLHGVPRDVPSRIRKLAKTERRPERPFGGYLCSRCMRRFFRSTLEKYLEEWKKSE